MNIVKNIFKLMQNTISVRLGYEEKLDRTLGFKPINDDNILDSHNNTLIQLPLSTTDISLATKRNQWVENSVYNQYDSLSNVEYHVSNNGLIFLCLSNNNGAISTQAPSSKSFQNIVMTDGYVWRYVGELNETVEDETSEFISVPSDLTNTAKQGIIARLDHVTYVDDVEFVNPQYKILSSNGLGAMFTTELDGDGYYSYISVINGGTGYTNDDYVLVAENFNGDGATIEVDISEFGELSLKSFTGGSGYNENSVLIIGDGVGASINPTFVSGVLTNVEFTNSGTGYTWAKVFVFSSNSSLVGKVSLEPNNGVGYDLPNQLRSSALLVRKTLDHFVYPDYVYDGMTYNQISVVIHDSNTIPLVGKKHPNDTLNSITDIKECISIENISTQEHSNSEKTYITIVLEMEV